MGLYLCGFYLTLHQAWLPGWGQHPHLRPLEGPVVLVLQIQNAPPLEELSVVQRVGQIHQQLMPLGFGFSQRSSGFCLFFWSLNELVTSVRGEGLAKMGFIRNVGLQGILESQLTPLLHLQTMHVRWSLQDSE